MHYPVTKRCHSNSDIERWDLKHKQAQGGLCKAPESELVRLIKPLQHGGLAADLACGKGVNSIFLAQRGFDVIAVDGSIEALRCCPQSSREKSLSIFSVVADLDTFIISPGVFDLIVMVRYLKRSIFKMIIDGVKPGGFVFVKTFNRQYLHLNPRFNSKYVLADGELSKVFSLFDIVDQNSNLNQTSSYVFARKPD